LLSIYYFFLPEFSLRYIIPLWLYFPFHLSSSCDVVFLQILLPISPFWTQFSSNLFPSTAFFFQFSPSDSEFVQIYVYYAGIYPICFPLLCFPSDSSHPESISLQMYFLQTTFSSDLSPSSPVFLGFVPFWMFTF
jgi:hypothetical protein